jgi:hypothetical protein
VSVGGGLTASRPLWPAFPAKLWPGRSKGDAVGFGATLGRGGGGYMATEEGKEACCRARCCLRQWWPRHSSSAGSCAEAWEDELEEASATRRRRKERDAPAPPFVPLLLVGSRARCEAGGHCAWHVSLAWRVRIPRRGVRREGGRRHHGAPTVHSDRLKESVRKSATQAPRRLVNAAGARAEHSDDDAGARFFFI